MGRRRDRRGGRGQRSRSSRQAKAQSTTRRRRAIRDSHSPTDARFLPRQRSIHVHKRIDWRKDTTRMGMYSFYATHGSARGLRLLARLFQLLRLVLFSKRVQKLAQTVTLHHRCQVHQREPKPMICDAILGVTRETSGSTCV